MSKWVKRLSLSTIMLIGFVCIETAFGLWLQPDTGAAQTIAYLILQATVLIVVFRRTAAEHVLATFPVLVACAWCALYPYAAFLIANPAPLIPVTVINVLLALSSLLAWRSIVSLGRSFGYRPARRQLITRGPYRAMRHPLYASYVIADAALLLTAPELGVLVIVASGWAALVARMLAEERVLSNDPLWAEYVSRVPYRLWPRVL